MARAHVSAHRIDTEQDVVATLVDMVRRSKRRKA